MKNTHDISLSFIAILVLRSLSLSLSLYAYTYHLLGGVISRIESYSISYHY